MMCVDSLKSRWLLCMSVLFLASLTASAADVRIFAPNITPSSSDLRLVVIEGQIQQGDYENFLKIVKENQGKAIAVYIFSAGGDFQEAMKIGKAVRALELSSHVPMKDRNGQPDCDDGGYGMTPKPTDPINCTAASAGFFIHIGGVSRGGNYLLVHRPYFEKGKFGRLPQDKAMKAFDSLQNIAETYMADMGVPKHIRDAVVGTPSDKGLLIDEKTIKTYFWGAIPYRHEWMLNRCTQLTGNENARLKNYDQLIELYGKSWPEMLGSTETQNYLFLSKKRVELSNCIVTTETQSQLDAYHKFFGVQNRSR